MALTDAWKNKVYELTRDDIRMLIAGWIGREVIHTAADLEVGFGGKEHADFIDHFIRNWRPVAWLMDKDGAHLVDAERAGEAACGWAMRCGMLEARVEALEAKLKEAQP